MPRFNYSVTYCLIWLQRLWLFLDIVLAQNPQFVIIGAKRHALSLMLMVTLQYISMLWHLRSLSLASDRLPLLKCVGTVSWIFCRKPKQHLASTRSWNQMEECAKIENNQVNSSKSILAVQRSIFTCHNGLPMLDVFTDHVFKNFLQRYDIMFYEMVELEKKFDFLFAIQEPSSVDRANKYHTVRFKEDQRRKDNKFFDFGSTKKAAPQHRPYWTSPPDHHQQQQRQKVLVVATTKTIRLPLLLIGKNRPCSWLLVAVTQYRGVMQRCMT